MAKLTLQDLASGVNVTTTVNANNDAVETAVENTLSRDGTSPNAMNANLDMNSNRIINLPDAVNNNEPITLSQAANIVGLAEPLTQATVGENLWPVSASETTAGLTTSVIDEWWPYGDVRRYQAVGNGVANDTTPLQNALDAGYDVYVDKSLHLLITSVTASTVRQRIWGGGTIETSTVVNPSTASHLLNITADHVDVEDIKFIGEGTFSPLAATDDSLRSALIKVTGNYVTVSNCHLVDGPQNFVHYADTVGGWILDNLFEGGITSFNIGTDTGYQSVRLGGACDSVVIRGNRFIRNASNGYTVEAMYCGIVSGGFPVNIVFEGNTVEDAWDHGVYANNGLGGYIIKGNNIRSDNPGIVCAGADTNSGNDVLGCVVSDNVVERSSFVADSVSGINIRDASNFIISGNIVKGFPRSIILFPVTYTGATRSCNNNIVANNSCINWTTNGIYITKNGETLGSVSNNVISGNTLLCDTTNVTSTGTAISFAIAQEAAANVAFNNVVKDNTINQSGDNGITLQYHTDLIVSGNSIVNPSEATTPTIYAGIYIIDCNHATVTDNIIRDNNGTVKFRSGIDGNNSTTSSNFYNNRVIGTSASYAALRRLQQASSGNSFRGNRTGNNTLTGTLTLANASTTTVTNDNWNYSLGYTSYVLLFPQDTAGAALNVWQDTASGTDKTSFVLDHSAAAGTEVFFYEIIQ